jgi:hypothetical protein
MDPITIAQIVIVCVSGLVTLIKYIMEKNAPSTPQPPVFPSNLKTP